MSFFLEGKTHTFFFHFLLRLLRPGSGGVCACTRMSGWEYACVLAYEPKPAQGIQSVMPRQFRNSHGIRIVKLLPFKKKKKKAKFWAATPKNTTKSYIAGDENGPFVLSQLSLSAKA